MQASHGGSRLRLPSSNVFVARLQQTDATIPNTSAALSWQNAGQRTRKHSTTWQQNQGYLHLLSSQNHNDECIIM